MTLQDTTLDHAADRLRHDLGDRIVLAGDPEWDTARLAWNRAIDQRPYAVARAETAEDVVDVVRSAVAAGLRVAPQSTGHAAGALADTDLGGAVLLDLSRLRGVTVDPVARTARALGGSVWNDVLAVASPHGLTALHGSAGDVSVVGYALSGGVSFYARAHGLAVNAVRAVQVVTADGSLRRASADENPDLFWAVRGGSGAFGVVVSIEIDLLPYPDVFAGMLLWDSTHADAVTRAWTRWTTTAPESATTTVRVMNFPPMPELPPFLSGRSLVVIDGAILADDRDADALLAPLRALEPEMDTFARIPAPALVQVHMDPPAPTPAVTFGAMVRGLPDDAVDAFLASATTPGVFIAELRHTGGALTRRPEHAGAIGSLDGDYCVHGVGVVPSPDLAGPVTAAVRSVVDALAAWHDPSLALTFVDGGVDATPGFGIALERLREVKRQLDPMDVFIAAHPVG